MLEIKFDTFPKLETPRLVLREMQESDVDAYFFFRSDPVVMRYIDRKRVESKEEVLEFMTKVKTAYSENEGVSWVLALAERPDTMIGDISIWRFDKPHHRGEVGYMLHPDYQGKGLMNEALNAVLHYGFETLNLHSLEANTNPGNTASQRLLERQGFVREAYFRENYHFDGQFLDSAIYSLIGREFLARQKQ